MLTNIIREDIEVYGFFFTNCKDTLLRNICRDGNHGKILTFPRKSIKNIYLPTIILACPRLCQI